MGLSLNMNKEKWRAHIDAFNAKHPGLVPVIKGEGYGLGAARLAHEAIRIGSHTIAVGTPIEADEIRAVFDSDILILAPWQSDQPRVPRAIHTISSIAAINSWHDQAPVVVEILTATRRHGVSRSQYGELSKLIGGLNCRGLAFHLPLNPTRSAHDMVSTEIENLFESNIAAISFSHTIWVSHIPLRDLIALRSKYPAIVFLERVGTQLWLGDSSTLTVTATVLDRHAVKNGDRIGYRQRRVRKNGWLLVVSGGTQNGIGLESPPSDLSIIGRIKVIVKALLVIASVERSPYSFNGKRLLFAEPPHMQCSLLLTNGENVPAIGSEIDVKVRHTTTRFDSITE
jgi:hypothetical protein